MNQLTSTFGDEATSKTTVYYWFSEFDRGRSMLTDEFKEGRPESVVVPQNIDAVRELTTLDRHVTYRELKASLGVSWELLKIVVSNTMITSRIDDLTCFSRDRIRLERASQEQSKDTHKTLHDCLGRKGIRTFEQINDGASAWNDGGYSSG
ncbi:Putative uncharacterized protein FLJ37770 [Eumeta japonica]|uniref:Mos1 transposase HTH domain-containing protein n=1 Tax=Eumeta variegata TaxID=151549 RepID=A0A4C1W8A7_EUMVA|nr:Putative uncharacterized protein FLJ37770 [Eumeta japonica]